MITAIIFWALFCIFFLATPVLGFINNLYKELHK